MPNQELLATLQTIVGRRYVLTDPKKTAPFRHGYRSGSGKALAVVRPGCLVEQWRALQACVAADKIIIMQAANTGLTEGSTPTIGYDRDVVIFNTRRMKTIQVLPDARQIIAFPGATLFDLEGLLQKCNREPHSVIGSSCIGASVVGGVCNNSGGALVARGPAYTQLCLYAEVKADRRLTLVNELGIELGQDPEEMLARLERKEYSPSDISGNTLKGSDNDYASWVRNIDSPTPARFNADPRRLHGASGCAGKLAVFAVRLDTFPKHELEKTYYIGTNDPAALTKLRRDILGKFTNLPVSAEYMHRDMFNISEQYGRDTVWLILLLGTKFLPTFFAAKASIDGWLAGRKFFSRQLTDRVLQTIARILPNPLPKSIRSWRDLYEHHLILKMNDQGVSEATEYLSSSCKKYDFGYFECSPNEAKLAFLNRFAAAGAAVRFDAVHKGDVEGILALDIALRRDDSQWYETLPEDIEAELLHKLYYGHFLCHVLHQDYIIKKGANIDAIKHRMLEILDRRGAKYPAEHNVGHLYQAGAVLAAHYKTIDPTNTFNAGVGKMEKTKNYSK
ncbi:MAG: D-lactate dehydrogenase [Alphaproteobacteria bacterium]|nr:D-lactate dehydrogenase [Alphaproteobacteria bacterium]